MTQGNKHHATILLTALFTWVLLTGALDDLTGGAGGPTQNFGGGVWAGTTPFTPSQGRYPNTESCATTPTIDFPVSVTISKSYLLVTECATPADFNHGDFVSIWIEDTDGSPIKPVSKYTETESGIVWTSPLSDTEGQAWEYLEISPEEFDCNSTGVPYTISVNWDGETATQDFSVYCPVITFDYYREELPYWQELEVVVKVKDNRGYLMRGIPCTATVIDLDIDSNYTTIMQTTETQQTDSMGEAKFEFSSGLLANLLHGYEYTTVVKCLGADQNFSFEVVQAESSYLRNPLYFTIVFLSDNIIPIVFAFIIIGVAIMVLYILIKKE